MQKTIIQIGSHVGDTINEPIFNIVDNNTKLILVEPVPFLFKQLINNYNKIFKTNQNIFFINKAVSNFIGEIEMTIPSENNNWQDLPFWASQLASVNSDHATGHISSLLVEKINVKTTTINEIVKEYNINQIDLLHTDTEGHDNIILMDYDFVIKPKKIIFEHKHMDGLFQIGIKYIELSNKLLSLGYKKTQQNSEDTTFELVRVCVLQTDNRTSLNYLLKTQEVNKKFCNILKYDYLFLELDNNKYGDIHPATKKIHVVNDILQNTEYSILVFLDSDAWIQNCYWLNDIINNLINNNEKQGCFSRDPYISIYTTFINSGSFIIKNNAFTKQMYDLIIKDLYNNNNYHNYWPYDQYYISKYIFENKEKFTIFLPDILNTPVGKVLRHNWRKNQKMYDDLNEIIALKNEDICLDKTYFIENDYYDDLIFPNIVLTDYEY